MTHGLAFILVLFFAIVGLILAVSIPFDLMAGEWLSATKSGLAVAAIFTCLLHGVELK